MHSILLVAQLAVAVHGPLSRADSPPLDSVALRERLDFAEMVYLSEWRILWQKGRPHLYDVDRPAGPDFGYPLQSPSGLGCVFDQSVPPDVDRHSWLAHLLKAPRPKLSLCPTWFKPFGNEPPDERLSIDASVAPNVADSMRKLRRVLLVSFDSAGRVIPGDGWLAGQRVRLHLDQGEIAAARGVATGCRAQPWWCAALLGYVQYSAREFPAASATFDRARHVMPDSVRCDWDDPSLFFSTTGRAAYQALSCRQRDSVNDRVWWLADPLYLENGNERRTEHYARHVLIALHEALDMDERFDWRPGYQGPALREMVLRYGWPTRITSYNPGLQDVDPPWNRFDTRSTFLGERTTTVAYGSWCNGQPPALFVDSAPPALGTPTTRRGWVFCDRDTRTDSIIRGVLSGRLPPQRWPTYNGIPCYDDDTETNNFPTDPPCNPFLVHLGIKYWGAQYHSVPLWETVLDPLRATDAGWDLAPARDGKYWDTSWWPEEFYRRDAGPLVPLTTQVAFFRRQTTAILAANMAFDTAAFAGRAPARVFAATILSTGPDAPFATARDTMDGRRPHAFAAAVASGRALLSAEMVPRDGVGPAGRSRFGVDAPDPLRTLSATQIALSDIVLTSADSMAGAPESFAGMLPRMLSSTSLANPTRVGMFWELYGVANADTVTVALRIVRHDDRNALQRFGVLLGLVSPASDTVTMRWTEPRPGDPTPTAQPGTSIHARGLVLDLSRIPTGDYVAELSVQRGGEPAVAAQRGFRIRR